MNFLVTLNDRIMLLLTDLKITIMTLSNKQMRQNNVVLLVWEISVYKKTKM